jgi:NTE family protein
MFSRVDTTDQTKFYFVNPQFCFELNNLNRKQYANSGACFKIGIGYVNGTETFVPGTLTLNKKEVSASHSWFYLKFLWDNYFASLGPFKFGVYTEAHLSNQPIMSNYTSTILNIPEFTPIPEMQTMLMPSYRAISYAGIGLKTVIRLYKKVEFRVEGYYFQPFQDIDEDPVNQTAVLQPVLSDRAWIASGALVYNSPLCPISLSVNYYDKMPVPVTINVNIGYVLFNRKALP